MVIKVIIIIWVILSLIAFLIYLLSNHYYKMNALKLTKYQIDISSTIDENTPNLLENIIAEALQDYIILNPNISMEQYLNSEKEAEIRDGVSDFVSSRLSPASINKLSLYYNEETLHEVIAIKIYIAVTNYVVEYNRAK